MSGFFELVKRKNGIAEGQHFHAVDLYENNRRLTTSQARALTEALINFLEVVPVRLKVLTLKKGTLRRYFKIRPNITKNTFKKTKLGVETRDIAYDILASNLFFWYGRTSLRKKRSHGAIIAESRNNADHSLLRAFLDCKEPDKYKLSLASVQRGSKNLREKVTSIKFENKNGECPGLEIADVISYVCYLYLNGRLNKFKKRGLTRLWKTIKSKLDDKEIQILSGKSFVEWLPSGRVYRISNFAKALRN